MKEYFLHTFLFFKKQFVNKIYICFLILLPVCLCIAEHFLSKADTSASIPVGYYFEFDDDELKAELANNFNEVSGRLNFIEYTDLDRMLNDTASAKLECAYVLTEELVDKIATDNYKKIVLVYNSPQTIISDMVNELVFTAIYRAAGDETLYYYLENNPELYADKHSIDEILNTVSSEYSEQLKYGNTFSLNFSVYDGTTSNIDIQMDTDIQKSLPIHGIIAIFLFLCLLLACTDYIAEVEKGTLIKLTSLKRIVTGSCLIHSWLFPASISSLLSIALLQGINNITKEFLIMLLYYMILLVFGIILIALIKKSLLITALIPLLIIGSLIFTPIIIDVSTFIPAARFIEKLFLPYYYMIMF